jgi:hypothetical protein
VIYAKASAGCEVPIHWHTAGGELFWISGTRQFKMKDIGEQTVKAGMFVRVPSKHQHSERCVTSCSFYAVGDQAFDIHIQVQMGTNSHSNRRSLEKANCSKEKAVATNPSGH